MQIYLKMCIVVYYTKKHMYYDRITGFFKILVDNIRNVNSGYVWMLRLEIIFILIFYTFYVV